jgi:hypothetical protein
MKIISMNDRMIEAGKKRMKRKCAHETRKETLITISKKKSNQYAASE